MNITILLLPVFKNAPFCIDYQNRLQFRFISSYKNRYLSRLNEHIIEDINKKRVKPTNRTYVEA